MRKSTDRKPSTIQYQVFDRNERVATKERTFASQDAMQRWVARQTETNGNFITVTAYEV